MSLLWVHFVMFKYSSVITETTATVFICDVLLYSYHWILARPCEKVFYAALKGKIGFKHFGALQTDSCMCVRACVRECIYVRHSYNDVTSHGSAA
jgi:hypothetical protein